MLKFFAISRSELMANALANAVKLRYPADAGQVFTLSYGGGKKAVQEELALFLPVFEAVEKEIGNGDPVHDRFIGILDLPAVSRAEDIHAFTSVQGMLILAFPEIQWIPLYRDGRLWSDFEEDGVMTLDRAVTLCRGGYSPLFDGDGLRSVLLERAHSGKYDPEHLSYSRTDAAFAIDEETSFTALNAYTAYRFGYRAFPISTRAAMDELLGKARNSDASRAIPWARGMTPPEAPRVVVFEDICIEFPDAGKKYNSDKIAFGDRRAENFPRLKTADLSVFTTTAEEDEKVFDRRKTVAEYFRTVKRRKPLSAQQSPLKRELEHLSRYFFNLSGGFWPGYWLISGLEAAAVLTLLLVSFFKWQAAFLPLLLAVFVVCGLLRQKIHEFLLKTLRFAPGLCALIRRREQWPFMPKCYENHCPVSWDRGEKYWETARKPLAGIFGLRNKCRLPNGRNYSLLFKSADIKKQYKAALRTAPEHAGITGGQSGHAAPGVALELATRLLRRAERMKDDIIDAEGAVHAAVLANVAVELLNDKTPAVSIEAFKWKHYFEILAECEFVGVRANLDMADRYIDIHNGMERICRSESTGHVREAVFLSAMAELVDQLSRLLGDKSNPEEAAFFRTHSRRLHRKLMAPFGRSLLAYPEWVLRSKWHFMTSLGLFFIVFLAYCLWHKLPQPDSPFTESLVMAYQVMISRMNVGQQLPHRHQFIVLMACHAGNLHLGFVIAHFLMLMNRK